MRSVEGAVADPRAHGGRLSRDRAAWLLVGVVVALAIPYAIAGPRLILDDWFFLRNAHFDGAFAAGGARQLAGRPGSWLLYALQFGLIGRRPMALYALQTVANAAVAVALFAAARRFVDRHIALAIALVWVLLPNHASLSRWFSTFPAVVALLLVMIGVFVLDADPRRAWLAIGFFVVAGLCYEAVIPPAMFVLAAVPVLRRRRVGAESLAGLLALAVVTEWVWTHRLYPDTHAAGFDALFPIHFGSGIAASSLGSVVLALVAGAAITAALLRLALPSFRASAGRPERLVLAGLVIIGVGSAAFFRWPWTVTGINDRANIVGSIGAATVWVGIALMALRVRRQLAIAAVIVAGLLVVPAHLQRDLDYRRAGNDAAQLLAVARRAPLAPDRAVVLDPWAIRSHHEVYGLFDWMTPHAVQLVRDDPTVTARFRSAR